VDIHVSSSAPSAGRPQRLRLISRVSIAEGALVLVALYALVGAGIGAAAGSVLAGMLLGLFTGVCAVAAILLISGAAMGGERMVTPRPVVAPRQPAVAPVREMSGHH